MAISQQKAKILRRLIWYTGNAGAYQTLLCTAWKSFEQRCFL